jgi:hypothetical protein
MNYQTNYIVIKLPLETKKGFSHVPKFDKNNYAERYSITLNGEPKVQYENDHIILIFEGFTHPDESPAISSI